MRASYNKAKREHLLFMTEDELGAICNALNEVCNGIDIDDHGFQTRLGVTRQRLRALLAELQSAGSQTESGQNV